ncbi:hypothetical protein [Streptomyces sp. NBC_00878]|uniref:DUF6907 domain-containing protein n=1 Tax=Streptomyces sp. NBC_00878 TaxID=2975854 RepID=UPI002259E5F4|nr:hypothetical protein [Streptomyces sp. NBC_00878]MCX4906845.1 hypothetical protein [Streptomyces sp. NBC_00878]
MSVGRTVTLQTSDHGDVTLPCPAWCVGHADHDPESARADLMHVGPEVDCTHLGVTLFTAELVQSPFAGPSSRYLGGRTPGVSIHPLGKTLDPADLYSLAAQLDAYADRLRDMADRLSTILGGAE